MVSDASIEVVVDEDVSVNELIISQVKKRPCLWDVTSSQYKDQDMRKKSWIELSQEMNISDDFARKRWRSLRDRYIREIRKYGTKGGMASTYYSSWSLMPSLDFLKVTVGVKRPPTQSETKSSTSDVTCTINPPSAPLIGYEIIEVTPMFKSEPLTVTTLQAETITSHYNALDPLEVRPKDNEQEDASSRGLSGSNPASPVNQFASTYDLPCDSNSRKRGRTHSEENEVPTHGSYKLSAGEHFFMFIAKETAKLPLQAQMTVRLAAMNALHEQQSKFNVS